MAGPAGCTPGRPAGRRVPADRSAVTGPAGSSRLGSARIELSFFSCLQWPYIAETGYNRVSAGS